MDKSSKIKNQIFRAMLAQAQSRNNEKLLEMELSNLFKRVKTEVIKSLHIYWSDYNLLQGQVDLICLPIIEAQKEYFEIIAKFIKKESKLGSAEAKRLVNLINRNKASFKKKRDIPISGVIDNNPIFGTSQFAEDQLLKKSFVASENTMGRIDSNIKQIIIDGYKDGRGINKVANNIIRRFGQISSWEARRIARTEIHNAHNNAVMRTYEDMGVEYVQWKSANDNRTRGNHAEIDGEIIRLGDVYSNGLAYPGDTRGDISEWINCRCAIAPFVMPFGKVAPPGMIQFRESDLIDVDVFNHGEIIMQASEDSHNNIPQVYVKTKDNERTLVSKENDINGRIILTKEQINSMSLFEIAEYHGARYKGVRRYNYDGKQYHLFEQTFDFPDNLTVNNQSNFAILFEVDATNSFREGGVTIYEVINEVLKAPNTLKRQTNQIWFKGTNDGIIPQSKGNFDQLPPLRRGYNIEYKVSSNNRYRDPNHRIVINPKNFKSPLGLEGLLWDSYKRGADNWKKVVYHELIHSIDLSRENFRSSNPKKLSERQDFINIHNAEPQFTDYSNNNSLSEELAEHGGYIIYMLNNPHEQTKHITITLEDETTKDITFKEYREKYPLHYEYCIKLLSGDMPCY